MPASRVPGNGTMPVPLSGKPHRRRGIVGYSPWGHKELDTTEWLQFHFHFQGTRMHLEFLVVNSNSEPLLNNPSPQKFWVFPFHHCITWLTARVMKRRFGEYTIFLNGYIADLKGNQLSLQQRCFRHVYWPWHWIIGYEFPLWWHEFDFQHLKRFKN